MHLTGEQVHWLLGASVAVLALVLVFARLRGPERGRREIAVPIALLALAVETWVEPWLHGTDTPAHGAAETAQHWLLGALAGFAGVVELLRWRGRLAARGWALAFPAMLAAAGVVFLIHRQHGGEGAALLLAQHRVMGLTLIVAGLLKAVAEGLGEPARELHAGRLVAILLFGLELLVCTEGGLHP